MFYKCFGDSLNPPRNQYNEQTHSLLDSSQAIKRTENSIFLTLFSCTNHRLMGGSDAVIDIPMKDYLNSTFIITSTNNFWVPSERSL